MVDLADPDPEKRAEAFDVHCRCLEGLAVLGVPHFVVHQVSAAESDPEERLRVGLSSVMRLRFVAKEFGIRLLVENFTIFDPEDLLDFVDLAGEDGLGVVLRAQGNRTAAEATFREALELLDTLAGQPGTASLRQEVEEHLREMQERAS